MTTPEISDERLDYIANNFVGEAGVIARELQRHRSAARQGECEQCGGICVEGAALCHDCDDDCTPKADEPKASKSSLAQAVETARGHADPVRDIPMLNEVAKVLKAKASTGEAVCVVAMCDHLIDKFKFSSDETTPYLREIRKALTPSAVSADVVRYVLGADGHMHHSIYGRWVLYAAVEKLLQRSPSPDAAQIVEGLRNVSCFNGPDRDSIDRAISYITARAKQEPALREAMRTLRPYIKLPLSTSRDYHEEEKFEAALAVIDAKLLEDAAGAR